MRKMLILAASAFAMTALAPATSNAQIVVDTPVGGVRIGEPRHDFHPHYGYRAPIYNDTVVERRMYREREVRGPGCKIVTIREPDGSSKRIERCN